MALLLAPCYICDVEMFYSSLEHKLSNQVLSGAELSQLVFIVVMVPAITVRSDDHASTQSTVEVCDNRNVRI